MRRKQVMSHDPDVLHGLSDGELEALADGLLAPSLQVRLDELIAAAKRFGCLAWKRPNWIRC